MMELAKGVEQGNKRFGKIGATETEYGNVMKTCKGKLRRSEKTDLLQKNSFVCPELASPLPSRKCHNCSVKKAL